MQNNAEELVYSKKIFTDLIISPRKILQAIWRQYCKLKITGSILPERGQHDQNIQ